MLLLAPSLPLGLHALSQACAGPRPPAHAHHPRTWLCLASVCAPAGSGSVLALAHKASKVRSVTQADDEVVIKQMQEHLAGRVHALPPTQPPPADVVACLDVSGVGRGGWPAGGERAGLLTVMLGGRVKPPVLLLVWRRQLELAVDKEPQWNMEQEECV